MYYTVAAPDGSLETVLQEPHQLLAAAVFGIPNCKLIIYLDVDAEPPAADPAGRRDSYIDLAAQRPALRLKLRHLERRHATRLTVQFEFLNVTPPRLHRRQRSADPIRTQRSWPLGRERRD